MEVHETLSIRVNHLLSARLLRQIERLQVEHPGIRWNRSNVVRVALLKYLEIEEQRAESESETADA